MKYTEVQSQEMALTQSPSLSNNPKGSYQPYDFYRDVQCLYTMCILGLLHVNLYCADTIMCWPIVQVPSANAAGEHWQNRGGERYQGQHAKYGLCNDSPKYFACHVITYKILLFSHIILNKFRSWKWMSTAVCQQYSSMLVSNLDLFYLIGISSR